MAQVQCPNCGGYKIQLKKEPIWTKKLLPWEHRKQGMLWGVGTVLVVCIIAVLIPRTGVIDGILACIGVFAILGILSLLFMPTQRVMSGTIYHFTCDLCGYRWDWVEGTPLPEIHIRPDLIAKGEQRLAEERRRQEELAAFNYLQQQRKKK